MMYRVLLLCLFISGTAWSQNLDARGSGRPFGRKPTQIRSNFIMDMPIDGSGTTFISGPTLGLHKSFKNKNAQIFELNRIGVSTDDFGGNNGPTIASTLDLAYAFHYTILKDKPIPWNPYTGIRASSQFAHFHQNHETRFFSNLTRISLLIGTYYHINRSFLIDIGIFSPGLESRINFNRGIEEEWKNEQDLSFTRLGFSIGMGWILP